MDTAELSRGPNVPSPSEAPRRSWKPNNVVPDQLVEPSERALKARELGGNILTLYQVNLFHAEAVLYKYVKRSEIGTLGYRMEWRTFQGDLDRYLHAKKQYSTLKRMSPEMIPSFGGLLHGVEAAGRALLDIEFETERDEWETHRGNPKRQSAEEELHKEVSRFDLKTRETGIGSAEAKAEQDRLWTATRKRFVQNTIFAVFSGLTLIAPMLIMTLHPTLLTTLLTTSLFVIAIAATLAAVMDTAEPKDIVGATAAYAAVLVVFIGTSGGAGGGNLEDERPDGGQQKLSNGTVAGIVVSSLTGAMLFLFAAVKVVKKLGPDRKAKLSAWWKKSRHFKKTEL